MGIKASPGSFIALAAGIAAVTVAIIAYHNSFDKLVEKAEEAKEAYESTVSELESLESQYVSTKKQIKELEELNNRTASEDETLNKLKQ